MPLSPEQEWTLVACGLIAHADGILEAGEWDRVLWMLDERLDGEDAQAWVDLVSNRDKLRARLGELAPPPLLFAEEILEKAWRMALADGSGSDEEKVVHEQLAERLEVDPAEVERLRATWLAQAQRRAESVAGFAAVMANLDGRLDDAERQAFSALLARLPISDERRQHLLGLLDNPPEFDSLVGQMLAFDAEERGIVLMDLLPLVRASSCGQRERDLFIEIATRLARSRRDAEAMLEH